MVQNALKTVAVTLIIALLFSASMPLAFGMDAKVKDHSIKGILEPYKGALVLRDMTSGIRYHLAGQDLSAQRGKMVIVTGQVSEDAKGDKTINVAKYETIKVK